MPSTFKLRAEYFGDVDNLWSSLRNHPPIRVLGFLVEFYPEETDPLITLTVEATLDEVKARIRVIEDGHVMLETIAPLADYTGERISQ